MHDFKEDLLQFIWKNRLLKPVPLISRSGQVITILQTGQLNKDAGPDFSNGQIKINDLLLAGNIEVHIRTSDWLRHAHQNDRSYDNIILHVVYEHDLDLEQNLTFGVEVLEIKDLIGKDTLNAYSELASSPSSLPCKNQLVGVPDINFAGWLERMGIERLESKVEYVRGLFEETRGDFTQTFYILLAKSFGFKVNALPFEMLGRTLPVNFLLRHSDSILQLEALLLGYAGLLEESHEDQYLQKLQNEFEFLKRKYSLVPLQKKIFKLSKMRPANFPATRLVQLAQMIHQKPSIFTAPYASTSFKEIDKALQIVLPDYWLKINHQRDESVGIDHTLGALSRQSLMINAFAPFFFFYGRQVNRDEFCDMALQLLRDCAAEDNVKVRHFAGKKNMINDAACSQGLIHLFDNYCSHKKCLSCGLAASMLQATSPLKVLT